ncbi:MAG: amidase [Alphaproteobacteria bacterium HGW-Alphaproteobacteria-2]|nr:MAG: amidase [Alphaproteobacteria bacterium HGW-Alphaproteobacteria-2]
MAGEAAILGLDADEMRARLATGALRSVELAHACLSRIREVEPQVRAWAWLDEGHITAEAERLDALRALGRAIGPLHGLPVALKDIIDTARIPTENGCTLDAGRVPVADAWVVRRLKAAGALIMGKTVTTELAYLHPGKTRNPVNPGHTPGGSSQGSAAAVASGMVPLALGTQTGGSVIRPAAYCGCVGFKPSFGAIPRTGILTQSPSLDTVGVFASSVEGAALLAEVLFGDDPADPATSPAPPPRLFETCMARPPLPPVFALLPHPPGAEPEPEMAGAFAELTAFLGEQGFEFALPGLFDGAAEVRERINFAEMAKCYYNYERRGWDSLSPETRAAMEKGRATPARDYIAALDWFGILNAALDEVFDRCDAILTPATPGPAPMGLSSTGSAIYNGVWTLCGTPSVTLPLFTAGNGLPMGTQLIGRRGDDARLLRTARWLWQQVTTPARETQDA